MHANIKAAVVLFYLRCRKTPQTLNLTSLDSLHMQVLMTHAGLKFPWWVFSFNALYRLVSSYDFHVPGTWTHLEVESVALRAAQRKGKAVDLSGLHGDGRLALSILSSLNPEAQSHGRS